MPVQACYAAMLPGLIDSAAISVYGRYRSKAGKFVGTRLFGYGKKACYCVDNLGKAENRNIDEAMFIPAASPAYKKTAGILTVNGKMKICTAVRSVDPAWDCETEKENTRIIRGGLAALLTMAAVLFTIIGLPWYKGTSGGEQMEPGSLLQTYTEPAAVSAAEHKEIKAVTDVSYGGGGQLRFLCMDEKNACVVGTGDTKITITNENGKVVFEKQYELTESDFIEKKFDGIPVMLAEISLPLDEIWIGDTNQGVLELVVTSAGGVCAPAYCTLDSLPKKRVVLYRQDGLEIIYEGINSAGIHFTISNVGDCDLAIRAEALTLNGQPVENVRMGADLLTEMNAMTWAYENEITAYCDVRAVDAVETVGGQFQVIRLDTGQTDEIFIESVQVVPYCREYCLYIFRISQRLYLKIKLRLYRINKGLAEFVNCLRQILCNFFISGQFLCMIYFVFFL